MTFCKTHHTQGRNENRWRRGKSTFGAPVFEPDVFRKQMRCIEENTCDIVGTFRRSPAVIRRPGNCFPLATPLTTPEFW